MGEAFSKLGINPIFLMGQIVNFLILFFALRFLLWKPLMQRLDERRKMLDKQQEDVQALEEARANIEDEREHVLSEAREQARKIVAEGREQAKEIINQAEEEANQKAKTIVQEQRDRLERTRNQALSQARGQIAALATAAAQKIIEVKLDEERQHALVASFFSGIQDGQVGILPSDLKAPSKDVAIKVTSAVPLTEEEKDVIRLELSQRLNDGQEIYFEVNPDILGGLVIRVGDRVLDDSVVGKLEKLQASLA